jgi:hypothetical protein
MPEFLQNAIQPDGSLYIIEGEYISWHLGNETVHIDGIFTAEQLRALADYMDKATCDARTGADLIDALQASPCRDIDIEPERSRDR